MVFDECSNPSCIATCDNPEPECDRDHECVPACSCKEGMLVNSQGTCVWPKKCGGDGGGSTGGYGDPHFHIVGRDQFQPDLCFDYDGEPGTNEMKILEDYENNIRITSTLFQLDNSTETYFKSITLVNVIFDHSK